MPFRWDLDEHVHHGRFFLRWLAISLLLGGIVGSSVALFLWSLEKVTQWRWHTVLPAGAPVGAGLPWLLFLLPVAGVAIAAIYSLLGKSVEAGNNLIVDQIHEPGGGVPLRMAPLVLIGTLMTHLFGGSAGREGTAVQMGGSLASGVGRVLRLTAHNTRLLLMAGVGAGFGAVFGTPLAGAIFAMEVLTIGRMSYEALLPCLMSAIAGDQVCAAWGIRHTTYRITVLPADPGSPYLHLEGLLAVKVLVAAIAFGLASVVFAELAHSLSRVFKMIRIGLLRPVVGALALIALALFVGRDYLGLGVSSPYPQDVTILSCFEPGGASAWSWWWKIVFTAITISSGFKGGEVTPLFFVGAALGNALARALHAPVDLFAGLGFVAVFAGATNTPLACTLMGIELFGASHALYLAIACFVAYFFSGHNGIYLSQRIGTPKSPLPPPAGASGSPMASAQPTLRHHRELLPSLRHKLSRYIPKRREGN